jgi:hypothetical protein
MLYPIELRAHELRNVLILPVYPVRAMGYPATLDLQNAVRLNITFLLCKTRPVI